MSMTDPIADLLTRIRNANMRYAERVEIPASKLKLRVVEILKQEGFIRNFRVIEQKKNPRATIRVYLKYGPSRERVITSLQRVSKGSVRRYAGKDSLPRVIGGMGIAIISTSQGLMTDREARRRGIGGEILCEVF